MEKQTIWTKIRDIFREPYLKMEYFFAKQWLDKNFGKREYWGEEIQELIIKSQSHKDNK